MDQIGSEFEQKAKSGLLEWGSLERAVEAGLLSLERAREIANMANADYEFLWMYLRVWQPGVSPILLSQLVSELKIILSDSEIPELGRFGFECFLREVGLEEARSTGLCDLLYSLIQKAQPKLSELLAYVAFSRGVSDQRKVSFQHWLTSQIIHGPNLTEVHSIALLFAWRHDDYSAAHLLALFMGAHSDELAEAILRVADPNALKLRKLFTYLREHGSQPSYRPYSSLLEMAEKMERENAEGHFDAAVKLYNDNNEMRILYDAAVRGRPDLKSQADALHKQVTAAELKVVRAIGTAKNAETRAEDLQRQLEALQSAAARRRWWLPW